MSVYDSREYIVGRHPSIIQRNTLEYKDNVNKWQGLLEELRKNLHDATSEVKPKTVNMHKKRDQLSARERVELLLDEDSPFMELCALAGYGQKDMTLGGSIVGGIGLVNGILCLIQASVPTMAGGASNEASMLKAARLYQIAFENRLPTIALVHYAGADLEQQFRVFHKAGGIFRQQAIQSKAGIPSCCVVFGSSAGGGAYTPGMSDYIIMVQNQSHLFLGGPSLIQMATGEVTDLESLGGADMHARVSGVADQIASDEYDGIRKARDWIAHLNWRQKGNLPRRYLKGDYEEPYYSAEELLGIVSANVRVPFDATEVIIRLVDGSRFTSFKPNYGSQLVCGWAYIHGIPVGFIANNNLLFTQEANKATQFIQLCNMKNTPLIFLQNVAGFMVGKQYEEEGIIKAGSRFVNAVSNSTVPAITIMMGASYGAGNYAMCGRAFDPRFLFSWPNSRCSVMGAEQLTGVLELIMRQNAARAGLKVDEEMAAQRKALYHSSADVESHVYYTSSRLLDDGVIDPRDTRTVIGFCLASIYNDKVEGGNLYGVSRM